MGDWADDLANEWMRRIRAGETDEPALAMEFRRQHLRGEHDATADIGRRLRDVLGNPANIIGWEGE